MDDRDEILEVNTTPLIDVMLVLLVMLIITIPIQTHAVKLDMPRPTDAPPPKPPTVIIIEIDFDGAIYWDGNRTGSEAQLLGYLSQEAAKLEQPEIHVRPNRLAKYGRVAMVLGDAQRLGIRRIGVVGNERLARN